MVPAMCLWLMRCDCGPETEGGAGQTSQTRGEGREQEVEGWERKEPWESLG